MMPQNIQFVNYFLNRIQANTFFRKDILKRERNLSFVRRYVIEIWILGN